VTTEAHLVITLVICLATLRPLADARWVWRSPRTGILLWQMVALTAVLCVGGIAFLVTPWLGVAFTGLLLGAVAHQWAATLRKRHRHRQILSLVAREDTAVPGVLVLDHPLTVAYCVPGLRSRVVVSSGALATLTPDEVAAVLAHEQTHARERHDLVLLPFLVLRPLCRFAADAVALLVEMRADQSAAPRSLATALHRFTAVTPPGALGMADAAVVARLQRLHQEPLPNVVCWLVVLAGLTLVSTPLSFLVW
jgi:Zn-dependent protease with chaperone function